MLNLRTIIMASIITCAMAALPLQLMAHGDVSPQPVNTDGLEALGEDWVARNPYSGNDVAINIGKSAYNQNCARCHGLGGVSGGIAPDLRYLPYDAEGDEWYVYRVRSGAVRNNVTYMPVFATSDGGPLSQEALWTIRAWLETVYEEQ